MVAKQDEAFVAMATKRLTRTYRAYHRNTKLLAAYHQWSRATEPGVDPEARAAYEAWSWEALFQFYMEPYHG
jgi:hypothetical protein